MESSEESDDVEKNENSISKRNCSQQEIMVNQGKVISEDLGFDVDDSNSEFDGPEVLVCMNDENHADGKTCEHVSVDIMSTISSSNDEKYSDDEVLVQTDGDNAISTISSSDDEVLVTTDGDNVISTISSSDEVLVQTDGDNAISTISSSNDENYSNDEVSGHTDGDHALSTIGSLNDEEMYSNNNVSIQIDGETVISTIDSSNDEEKYSNDEVSSQTNDESALSTISSSNDEVLVQTDGENALSIIGLSNDEVLVQTDGENAVSTISSSNKVLVQGDGENVLSTISSSNEEVSTLTDGENALSTIISINDEEMYSNDEVSVQKDGEKVSSTVSTGNDKERFSNDEVSAQNDVKAAILTISSSNSEKYSNDEVSRQNEVTTTNSLEEIIDTSGLTLPSSPLSYSTKSNLNNSLDGLNTPKDQCIFQHMPDSEDPIDKEHLVVVNTSSSFYNCKDSEKDDSMSESSEILVVSSKGGDIISEISTLTDSTLDMPSRSSIQTELNNDNSNLISDMSESSESSKTVHKTPEKIFEIDNPTLGKAMTEDSINDQNNDDEMETQLSMHSNHDFTGLDLSLKSEKSDDKNMHQIERHSNNSTSSENSTVSNDPQKDDPRIFTTSEEKIVHNNQVEMEQHNESGILDAVNSSNKEMIELDDEETGFPKIFQGLLTKGKYISVKGDFTLRSTDALVESPSLVAPFLLKEPDSFPEREIPLKAEKNFFASSVGDFLKGLGFSHVKEWYHRDMVNIKNRALKKGKGEHLEEDLKMHQSNYTQSRMANKPYNFPLKQCTVCNFQTESSIVLEGHMLAPHHTQKREYECSFCSHSEKDPKSVVIHMKICHNKVGHIIPPRLLYECSNCVFECHSRPRFLVHQEKCSKYFKGSVNQAPPKIFDCPCLTPKPITVAVVKLYEKSLSLSKNIKAKKPNNSVDAHNQFNQISENNCSQGVSEPPPMKQSKTARKSIRSVNAPVQNYTNPSISGFSNQSYQPYGGVVNPILPFSFMPFATNQASYNSNQNGLLSIGSSYPPSLQGPYPVQMDNYGLVVNSPTFMSSLVVCEICDGYIKDMEQLGTHMQLIHKVKIHPKVLSSRPPLNCQKCQSRFFTDQGLERHLLGAHGLVTSNMQELSQTNKDAGCCIICGRVFASKLVLHMSQTHKITLKPAHLSYKCTVCSATFNLYRLFESHVYLVHSNASKKLQECTPSTSDEKFTTWDRCYTRRKRKRTAESSTS